MKSELTLQIGKRIKALREQRGLTQTHVAERAKRTIETISNLENGRTNPSLGTLVAIAGILKVDVRDLFPGEQLPMPECDPATFSLHSRLDGLDPEAQEIISVLVDTLDAQRRRHSQS